MRATVTEAQNRQATANRDGFNEVWKTKAAEARIWCKVWLQAAAFFGAALAMTFLLPLLEDNPMVNAARESLIADLMQQDIPEHPEFKAPKIDYISVPEAGCESGYQHPFCAASGVASRTKIASLVRSASESAAKVLVIDAVPSDAPCDDGARQLLKSITAAVDAGKIAIMPRPLGEDGRPPVQFSTYFDICRGDPQISSEAENRIFYGQTTLEQVPPATGGVYGLMRTSAKVEMLIGPGESRIIKETPNVAIIAIIALNAGSPEKLRAIFDEAGLETRAYTTPAFGQATSRQQICDKTDEERSPLCAYPMDPDHTIRFRYGLDPNSNDTSVFYVVVESAVGATVRDQGDRNVDLNLIAADPWSSVDIHPTAIGRQAGGVILANQIYAGANGRLLEEMSGFKTWLVEAGSLALTAVAAALIAIFSMWLVAHARYKSSPADFDLSEWITWFWSVSIVVVSVAAAVGSWFLIRHEFFNGLISFAFLGVLLSFAKCVFLVERICEQIIEGLISSKFIGKAR